jgi:hypothetical protein
MLTLTPSPVPSLTSRGERGSLYLFITEVLLQMTVAIILWSILYSGLIYSLARRRSVYQAHYQTNGVISQSDKRACMANKISYIERAIFQRHTLSTASLRLEFEFVFSA